MCLDCLYRPQEKPKVSRESLEFLGFEETSTVTKQPNKMAAVTHFTIEKEDCKGRLDEIFYSCLS